MATPAGPAPSGLPRFATTISTTFVAVAAVIALIAQIPPAVTAWCGYFGFWCTYDLTPLDISGVVGPGSHCAGFDRSDFCFTPENSRYRLVASTLKFERAPGFHPEPYPFNNGDPTKAPPPARAYSGSGWYPIEVSQRKLCVRSYALTGDCDYRYAISGTLHLKQRLTIF
jgi:hypothetical protein